MNFIHTNEQPPTYHKTNKVTAGFQNLVNAYGIPSYQEINPAPFAVITFPFLFAVMFGDAGHGMIALIAALFLVKRENSLKKVVKGNEVLEIFFGGRYIILLMAIFSIYTGFIYNDFFSKSANLFGSAWRVGVGYDFHFQENSQLILNPNPNYTEKMYSGNPYPFGLDPVFKNLKNKLIFFSWNINLIINSKVWQLSINKISYTNTLKMKFSIIIGIMQMIFGLILGLKNHLYFVF